MGLFTNNLPKKPIVTLPSGYSEDKLINRIYMDVIFGFGKDKKEKDKLLYSVTSSQVLKFSINYAQALVNEFKSRFPDDLVILGNDYWKKIEATFFEGVYMCTLIFDGEKSVRGETIQVPTGMQFEEYFEKECKKFDESSTYADILIPPYMFQVIKKFSMSIFNELMKEESFLKTSKEFQESMLIQYMHLSSAVLAAYLIQDSFLK